MIYSISLILQDLLLRFAAAQAAFSGPRPPDIPVVWQPPQEGYLKANFDVSVSSDGSGVGLGVVVRDWHGSVLAWRHRRVPHINCPEIGEALVAR